MLWIIFFVFAAIVMTTELLLSAKRSFFVTLVRAASHVFTVVVSFIMAKAISPAIVMRLWRLEEISGSIEDPLTYRQATELVSENSPIAAALIAPLVFFALWLLIGIVFYIIYKIIVVSKGYKFPRESDESGQRVASMCIGVAMALMIIFTFWMPFAGYTVMIHESAVALRNADENGNGSVDMTEMRADIDAFLDAEKSYEAMIFSNKFSSFVFSKLTTYKTDGERSSLYRELPDAMSAGYALAQEYNSAEPDRESRFDLDPYRNVFFAMADASEKSHMEASLFSSYFRALARSQRSGEEAYLGTYLKKYEYDETSRLFDKIVDIILDDFSDTTAQTFPSDMRKFAGVIHDIFGAGNVMTAISSKDEKIDKKTVSAFFNEINPDSADTVSEIIVEYTDLLEKGSAELDAVNLFKDIYTDMANAKADPAFPDEKYEKEVDAVSEIIVTFREDSGETFKMLDAYKKSDIISAAVSEAVKNGSIGIFELSQEKLDRLTEEFEKYTAENGSDIRINDLAMLFGINI